MCVEHTKEQKIPTDMYFTSQLISATDFQRRYDGGRENSDRYDKENVILVVRVRGRGFGLF
jgi:hypothetical protein